ncbi:MAG: DNA alkylation repair protein [Bacteroidota bacterium]
MTRVISARTFIDLMIAIAEKDGAKNEKYFRGTDKENRCLGAKMGNIFTLAKAFIDLPLQEINKLLDSEYYEVRMGAVSIMDFKARDKKTTEEAKKDLFSLYIKRHDRINNWDLVDRSAPYVVGGYLADKSRAILYKLATSKNVWERRTAIVSTYYFIRKNEIDDTFKIAEMLINDNHEYIHMAVGSWIREAGKRDEQKLLNFLEKYAATMPRITLRYAVEKLSKELKSKYLAK